MNILFLTIAYPKDEENNIYSDLMQEFVQNGHNVYIACSNEKRNGQQSVVNEVAGKKVLRIRTGNLTGNINLLEKGLSITWLESAFIRAIRAYFRDVKFDMIIYSTPPITFARVVDYFKKRDKAKTYLLLKDIFPQNAVDLGLIKEKGILHRYFRRKEKKLYRLSDYIGCMSQANVNYVRKHNLDIKADKVEVCPNSIRQTEFKKPNKRSLRTKYHIPNDCTVFIYGGNLGKPQGIDFVIECLNDNLNITNRFFIICGQGAEYRKLEKYFKKRQPNNMLLINGLPKKDYDELVMACDVGLIFLDHRFTIPNFPSRLLSYMEYAMPVLACTDRNTDIGQVICEGKFGWWCESNDRNQFKRIIDTICLLQGKLCVYGDNARSYLEKNYTVKTSYKIIMKHFVNTSGGI